MQAIDFLPSGHEAGTHCSRLRWLPCGTLKGFIVGVGSTRLGDRSGRSMAKGAAARAASLTRPKQRRATSSR